MCKYDEGCGTVFTITPAGTEKVLYTFPGGPQGSYPSSGLVDVNGMLYGTTSYWGSGYAKLCGIASGAPIGGCDPTRRSERCRDCRD